MIRTSRHHHHQGVDLVPQFAMVLFLLIIVLLFVMALLFPTALA